jgi:hypothetical protein
MKFWCAFLVACAAAFVRAESLVSPAKVIRVTESGLVLQVGTEPIAVDDNSKTKFWKSRAVGKRDSFVAGENVMVRINTKEDPPELKEIADEATWKWLEDIKKRPKKGTVEKVDSKYVTVKFVEGGSFGYRATEKSEVRLNGKAATLADLTLGATIFVKGRTLPTLDVFAVLITDQAIPESTSKTKSASKDGPQKAKAKPLDPSGRIEGEVLSHNPEIRMFDIDQDGRKLHITYSTSTVFVLDGKPAKPGDLQPHQQAVITYKRDKSGRIIASRVELSSS